MGRQLGTAAVDLVAGFVGTALVILATDAAGADLRVYLTAAVTVFFALGLWRAGSAGPPPWLRLLLIALVALALGARTLVRHWPPDARGFAYAALFPLVQWVSAAAGFKLRRHPRTTARQLWLALGGAAVLAGELSLIGALCAGEFARAHAARARGMRLARQAVSHA